MVPSFLEFARNHQCIFYDQPGNGKSLMEKIDATTFTTDLLVEDHEALRKEDFIVPEAAKLANKLIKDS